MKRATLLLLLLTSLFLFTATSCDEDDRSEISCDQQLSELGSLGNIIADLASSSQCGEAFECRAIAFGSKPCGGPWSYLIYTTSIDTLQLQNLVEEYNTLNEDYNLNCDAISDCSFVSPPSGFECIDGECIAQ